MSAKWLDAAGPVREGQEIDVDRLAAYLRAAVPELPEGTVAVSQFARGFSNLTYLVEVGDRAVVLRRPPVGVHIATAHDMGREHRILTSLSGAYERAPRPLAFCEDETVIGTPFYLMERVEGVILRRGMPEGMEPDAETAGKVAFALIDALADLHALDYEAAGLGDLGRPAGYVRRQIEGWTKRYGRARTDEIPEAEAVARWLHDAIPDEGTATLIHNDFKHDNVVLDPKDWSRIVAVLDWEMATLGDPLMDLGTSLAYWTQADDPPELLSSRLGPTTLPGTPSRVEVVDRYASATGRDVERIGFYYVYGLFKVAVIVQQLYHRWVTGRTTDPRFESLLDGVRSLNRAAWNVARSGRIDRLD